MARIIRTTPIPVTLDDTIKPYDQREDILKLRRKGRITKARARELYNETHTLSLVDAMTHKVLSRGASQGHTTTREPTPQQPNPLHPNLTTGESVIIRNFIGLRRINTNDGWLDVAQEALLRTLEKKGSLDPEYVALAITGAALDLDRDLHGFTEMPNNVRDNRAVTIIDVDDAADLAPVELILEDDEDDTPADALTEDRIYALMSPAERAAVRKRMTGVSLTSAERMAIKRMRDRWEKAGIDSLNGLKKVIAMQAQKRAEAERAIERNQLPTRFEPDEPRQVIRTTPRPADLRPVTMVNIAAPLPDLRNPNQHYERELVKSERGGYVHRPKPKQRFIKPDVLDDTRSPDDTRMQNIELTEAAGKEKPELKYDRAYWLDSKGRKTPIGPLANI